VALNSDKGRVIYPTITIPIYGFIVILLVGVIGIGIGLPSSGDDAGVLVTRGVLCN
jgi:hypothetical protein